MKYQSELIKEIIDMRGHDKSSLHYESECIETWIEENKGAYPKLTEYQSEWLNYINENPIGNFPYETITDVTNATIDNVVPLAYQSAILKGSTKYRVIDTGEILEAFEEGRNLELVSVKMPVLTTTGKNLFPTNNIIEYGTDNKIVGQSVFEVYLKSGDYCGSYFHVADSDENTMLRYELLDEQDNQVLGKGAVDRIFTIENDGLYKLKFGRSSIYNGMITKIRVQIEEGSTATTYEPFKSIILTVNEVVTLRSNGSVCDELDLLTGKLTQRIDEDGEILTQEVVKTVDLTITNQDGETLNELKPIEGTMHLSTSGENIRPLFSGKIPVEAITQNLASFIGEE